MKKSGAKQVAERYVTALLEESRDCRRETEKDLKALIKVLKGSKELKSLLSNPLLTRKQQAQSMKAVCDAIGAHELTHRFVALLAGQKRLELLPEIIMLFAEKSAAQRGEMKAEVTASAPLAGKEADAIAARLTKAFGRKVAVETREDKELLGGVVVRVGSLQLDASLAGKLRRLGNKLRAA